MKNSAKSFGGVAVTFLSVFGLVGLLNVFVPASLIERLLGSSGGFTSLLIGDALGSVAAGANAAKTPAPTIDPRPMVTASAVPSLRARPG